MESKQNLIVRAKSFIENDIINSQSENVRLWFSIAVVSMVITAFVYVFPTGPRSVGIFYTNLTNVVAWFYDEPVIQNPNSVLMSGLSLNAKLYISEAEGYDLRNMNIESPVNSSLRKNFITKLLTFGNDYSLGTLVAAQIQGQYDYQYSLFLYDQNGEAIYYAKKLDAPSVVLYGYTWLVNIPTKVVAQIKDVYSFNNKYGQGSGLYFDVLLNIVSLVVEIPIAIYNTVVGFIIALIFNPIDSLCSIFGALYFIVYSTVSALWDFILVLFH